MPELKDVAAGIRLVSDGRRMRWAGPLSECCRITSFTIRCTRRELVRQLRASFLVSQKWEEHFSCNAKARRQGRANSRSGPEILTL